MKQYKLLIDLYGVYKDISEYTFRPNIELQVTLVEEKIECKATVLHVDSEINEVTFKFHTDIYIVGGHSTPINKKDIGVKQKRVFIQ